MNAADVIGPLEARFPAQLDTVVRSPRRLYVAVPPEGLREVVRWLGDHLEGLRLATATGIDLREGIGVWHHFAVNGAPLVITVKVVAPKPEPVVPSLARMIPAALWIEREIHELLGVTFEGHPDPRRLLKARGVGDDVYPLRRDFDARELNHGDEP